MSALWVIRGEKIIAPILGKGEGILSPIWGAEKWQEIHIKIFGDGGSRSASLMCLPWIGMTWRHESERLTGMNR